MSSHPHISDPVINEQTPAADFTIAQHWSRYTDDEHAIWNLLYDRQTDLLKDRAAPEFLDGLSRLNLDTGGIPDLDILNPKLKALTGWEVVMVPHLVPDDVFFTHLANRRFPAGRFIRSREQLEYLQEPDVFHDIFGHVPMLTHNIFADCMEAYGKGGLRALKRGCLEELARLYWYTVEFGLMRTDDGLRIYGAGIVSSLGESQYALDSEACNRLRFDLMRVMRTKYKIDDFQKTYFVIDSYNELFDATQQDFAPIYDELVADRTSFDAEAMPHESERL